VKRIYGTWTFAVVGTTVICHHLQVLLATTTTRRGTYTQNCTQRKEGEKATQTCARMPFNRVEAWRTAHSPSDLTMGGAVPSSLMMMQRQVCVFCFFLGLQGLRNLRLQDFRVSRFWAFGVFRIPYIWEFQDFKIPRFVMFCWKFRVYNYDSFKFLRFQVFECLKIYLFIYLFILLGELFRVLYFYRFQYL
jgi:hypothetical protein